MWVRARVVMIVLEVDDESGHRHHIERGART
jgi:hypothetical protein